jgi:hypothetical protein
MPLYELVLCFADREEVRLTDRPPGVGDTLGIDGRRWQVVRAEGPVRYACELEPDVADSARFVAGALAGGSSTVNVEPRPGSDSTSISPPMR